MPGAPIQGQPHVAFRAFLCPRGAGQGGQQDSSYAAENENREHNLIAPLCHAPDLGFAGELEIESLKMRKIFPTNIISQLPLISVLLS
jgi:hypothetical protein